jgi:hypothetical protein
MGPPCNKFQQLKTKVWHRSVVDPHRSTIPYWSMSGQVDNVWKLAVCVSR